jgi:hypothetical protein
MTLKELRQETNINITKIIVDGKETKLTFETNRELRDYIVTDILPYVKVVDFENTSVRVDCGICVHITKGGLNNV